MASIAATCLGTRTSSRLPCREQRLNAEGTLAQGKELGVGEALGLIQPTAAEHSVLVVKAEQRTT